MSCARLDDAGASANESPLVVGTKSMSISPKHTTREDSSFSTSPLSLGNALPWILHRGKLCGYWEVALTVHLLGRGKTESKALLEDLLEVETPVKEKAVA